MSVHPVPLPAAEPTQLALPADLVFDLALLAAAAACRCRSVGPRLLPPEERDRRRADLARLWSECSARIIDETLLADLHARHALKA